MSFIDQIALKLVSKQESPKANKQFMNWGQLSTGLIVAYDNQLADIVDFLNLCKKDGIHIQVAIIYNGKPEHAPKPHFSHMILDKKQFNFFGLPKNEILEKLGAKPLDILLNLGSRQQIKALAISKLLKAKCKISCFQDPIFDLSINGDKVTETTPFLDQVVVYLNMIKTK